MSGSAILLYGPPAAGKSSLARALMTRHRAMGAGSPLLYLGTDAVRQTVSGRLYLPSARAVVYDGVLALLDSGLRNGHDVLVDGNYLDPPYRDRLIDLVGRCGARLLKVLVSCGLEVALRRNETRLPEERVPEDYLREVYGRVELARETADLQLDSEQNLAGREADLLTWLLGASMKMAANASNRATARWVAHGQRRSLAAGEAVWERGQPSAEVIMLLEGELEVVREHPGEPPVVINRLTQGALAGDLSSLDGSPHSATVRATTPSVIVGLPAHHFRAVLLREPELLDHVLEGMAGRIRTLSGRAGTASVDLLTGLGNRRMLDDLWPRLAAAAERDRSPLAVAMFDVDRFKTINDSFGHGVGDTVLRQISGLLRDALPSPAVPLRYGGDEFVVLFPGHPNERVLALIAEFVKRVRSTPMAIDAGLNLTATVSIGVATYPEPVESPAELFEKADAAAYVSKAQGRDQVNTWTPQYTTS